MTKISKDTPAKRPAIRIGEVVGIPGAVYFEIEADAPELRRHANKPWLRAYVARQLGVVATNGTRTSRRRPRKGQSGTVADETLKRHGCIFGASGGGKTVVSHFVLVGEQLRMGHSLLAIGPKPEAPQQLQFIAQEAGLRPEQVTLISPSALAAGMAGVPGFNPLNTGIPIAQAVGDLVGLLAAIYASSWGPRLSHILVNALILLGSLGLSLFELPELLTNDAYREALLRTRVTPSDPVAYTAAHRFFAREFSGWSKAERTTAVAPIINKIGEFQRSAFWQALFGARRQTLDLSALWQRQHLVIAHLDRAGLGEDGARLLGGLLAYQVYRVAFRTEGPVPVVLMLDELGGQERFLGEALIDIVIGARSRGVRLLTASQHLLGISEDLRSALLGSTACKVFFRLGSFEEAKKVATGLAAGAPESVERAVVRVAERDKKTGRFARALWRQTVCDPHGQPIQLDSAAFARLRRHDLLSVGRQGMVAAVEALARASGITRLYVADPETGEPTSLGRYVSGLSETDFWFDGPSPLVLVICFPRPQITGVRRRTIADLERVWAGTLQDLPVRHAVLQVAGEEPVVIRVKTVAVPSSQDLAAPERQAYREAVQRACGQTLAEIADTAAWRAAQIERLATGQGLERSDSEGDVDSSEAPGTGTDPPPWPDDNPGPEPRDQPGAVADDGSLA